VDDARWPGRIACRKGTGQSRSATFVAKGLDLNEEKVVCYGCVEKVLIVNPLTFSGLVR
jgi:hypothetical protein